jgi:hypothetical protein
VGAHRGTRERSTTSGPTGVEATASQRIRGRSPRPIQTRTTLETRVARFPIPPPDPLLPSFPVSLSSPLLYLRSSDRFPGSFFMSSCSAPSLLACRRPASGLPPFTPGLSCPVFVCRSRKGGPARSGGPPFLESPGAQRNKGRRRGGGPLISKDQQLEINTHEAGSRTRRVHLRARAVGSRESVRGLSALVDGRSGFGRDPASHERMFVPGGGARLALRSHWRFLLSPHYSIGS